MADEATERGAVDASAAQGAKVSAPARSAAQPAPQPVVPPVPVPANAPAARSLRILILGLLGLTILLTVLALIREEVVQWPKYPRLVVVPRVGLPAYHQIQEADLRSRIRLADRDEAVTLKKASDIVGRYTLKALSEDEPIAENALGPAVNSAQFSGKTAAEVSLPEATILNQKLKAGDVVDITFEPPAQSFQNVFVLDVKPPQTPDPATPVPTEKNYVLVLALPPEHQAEFEAEVGKKTPPAFRKKELTR